MDIVQENIKHTAKMPYGPSAGLSPEKSSSLKEKTRCKDQGNGNDLKSSPGTKKNTTLKEWKKRKIATKHK